MSETSGRLLRLLSLLQSPRAWTGPELAARLAVTERTVRKDVDRLRALGYPVLATRGSTGGYRLGAGADVPPLLLDDEEAVAVAVGLRTATAGALPEVEEASVRALAKLERVLPARLRRRVAALAAYTVPVPRDDPGPRTDPALLTLLTGLCRDRERLRFDYRTHDGGAARRDVEPHRLVSWGRRWYLVAFDVDRRAWRTFRVDRMTPRVPTGPRFAPREPPADDLAAYVSRTASAAAWRYRARVVVLAPAEAVSARVPPAAGTVQALDGGTCVLETGADTVESLAVHLGLLGVGFRVDGPPELVAHLRTLAERYRAATG
jgi:predicted DNA-binding transcriptional regulator YafY